MEDKIQKNIMMARIFIAAANLIAGILFFVAYYLTDTIWYMIAGIALILAGVVGYIYFGFVGKKFNKIAEASDTTEKIEE